MNDRLISVRGLQKYFPVRSHALFAEKLYVKAVDSVDLDITRGEIIGLVGESGCGKSTLVNAILRLDDPTAGSIEFDGRDITHLRSKELRALREDMQIVFQDPFWSLNPRMLVRDIVSEPLKIHLKLSTLEIEEKAGELLEMVGLDRKSLYLYPHEFSGGQRQRIAISRALALRPKLVVLDEPTSSIDILSQAQILELLLRLKKEFNLTYILISHDLSVVHYLSDRIVVMYLGKIVEEGPSDAIFSTPQHPYSIALLNAVPDITKFDLDELQTLEGSVPSAINPPEGCRFHPRCPEAMEICKQTEPARVAVADQHCVSCHLFK